MALDDKRLGTLSLRDNGGNITDDFLASFKEALSILARKC